MTFDDVVPTLLRICEQTKSFSSDVELCAIARDLVGLVRVALKPTPTCQLDRQALENTLQKELGGYFARPILFTTDPRESGKLAQKVIEISISRSLDYQDPASGQTVVVPEGRWRIHESRLSKQSWLMDRQPRTPWDLAEGPRIVTFFSFKGGVGRTTALASCAWQLAAEGKRVAVLDLDLESPGLGGLLGAGAERGIVDFLVDFLASGSRDISALYGAALALGADTAAELIDVFPAGTINRSYLEKLARLDFLATPSGELTSQQPSPVEQALTALLHAIRGQRQRRPDYILLDARAGLHDLAGLSLHGLAHIDVVFSRASIQGYAGLDLTLDVLGQRKGESLLGIVVHSLAHPDPSSPEAIAEEAEFRRQSYESFLRHIYGEVDLPDAIPGEEAADAAHWPYVIRRQELLQRFTAFTGTVRDAMFGQDYRRLRARIEELAAAEEPSEV